MKLRAITAALATVAALGTVISAPTDAHPATGPVLSGNGWKLRAPYVTHLDTKPWTIAFHDTTSRSKLTPYVKNTAAELTARTGVTFTVTTKLVPASKTQCAPDHVITLRYMRSPVPDYPNQSISYSCGNTYRAAKSSSVYINSVYWDPARRYTEPVRQNVIWHEMGHAVGLAHPDTCPRDTYGIQPVMCATGAGGYKDLRTRRYTTWDATGLRQLVANRAYAPTLIPTAVTP